jgi:hypothetical protein
LEPGSKVNFIYSRMHGFSMGANLMRKMKARSLP